MFILLKSQGKYHFLWLYLLLLLPAWNISQLSAQTELLKCNSGDCNRITLQKLEDIGNLLRSDYGQRLADRLAGAHFVSNIGNTPYIGDVSLNHFTIGTQLGGGLKRVQGEVTSPVSGLSISQFELSPIIAFQGLIYAGVRMGSILDLFDVKKGQLGKTELFFGFGSNKGEFIDLAGIDTITYDSNSIYLGIRYCIIEPIGFHYLFRWQGLSVQYGYLNTTLDIDVIEDDSSDLSFNIVNHEMENLLWTGETTVNAESDASTHSFELNTGFKILYFLNLTVGGGFAFTNARSETAFNREGELLIAGEDGAPPTKIPGGGLDSTHLSANFGNKGELSTKRNFYFKSGFSLNAPYFQAGMEITYISNEALAYGASVRVNI